MNAQKNCICDRLKLPADKRCGLCPEPLRVDVDRIVSVEEDHEPFPLTIPAGTLVAGKRYTLK